MAPWGKTWIDDAAWGFAPFHYGRWIKIDTRWAWLPGETGAPPVYAPALVSFFDTPEDKDAPRRWIPLGPEEPYLPPYPVSIVYFRAVNAPAIPAVVKITNITNITQVTNVVQIVKRRPVLIIGRLVNRPGAPPPKPRPRSSIEVGRWAPAVVVTKPGPLPAQFKNTPAVIKSTERRLTVQKGPSTPGPVMTPAVPAQTKPSSKTLAVEPVKNVIVVKTAPAKTSPGMSGGSVGLGGGTAAPKPSFQHCTPTVGIACIVGPD